MIKLVVGVPHIPFLEVLMLFNEIVGSPLIHLDASRYGSKVRAYTWEPDHRKTTLSCRFVYAATLPDLAVTEPLLAASKQSYVVLVGGDGVTLHEHKVAVFPRPTLSKDDVLYLNNVPYPQELIYEPLERHLDLAKAVYENLAAPSILQLVHTLFYRILDKTQRAQCQASTYRYLCGDLSKPPVSGVNKLDGILRSDEAKELRDQVVSGIDATREVQEELNYDVRYVLAKAGRLKA